MIKWNVLTMLQPPHHPDFISSPWNITSVVKDSEALKRSSRKTTHTLLSTESVIFDTRHKLTSYTLAEMHEAQRKLSFQIIPVLWENQRVSVCQSVKWTTMFDSTECGRSISRVVVHPVVLCSYWPLVGPELGFHSERKKSAKIFSHSWG